MSTPSAPGPHPIEERVRHLRARENRVRGIGFGVSLVLHLVGVAFYAGIAGPPTVRVTSGTPDAPSSLQGLELLNLIEEVEETDEGEDDPDRPEETPILPQRPVIPLEVSPRSREEAEREAEDARRRPAAAGGPEGPSAAQRLRVRTYDERLWDFSSEIYEPSTERRLTAELAGRIDLWADSLAAALERDARATDWTWTDTDGNRWGVSPGKLHLGSLTLPLPFGFGIPPGRFEEYMQRQYVDRELARNALTGVILETWRDRAEAMKRRRDRERAEAAEASGPRRLVPDSLRRRGGG